MGREVLLEDLVNLALFVLVLDLPAALLSSPSFYRQYPSSLI